MSSRNLRLTEEQRKEAAVISTALHWLKYSGRGYSLQEAIRHAASMIEASGNLKVEYLEIADSNSLQRLRLVSI
jgi:pantothenate synthetase